MKHILPSERWKKRGDGGRKTVATRDENRYVSAIMTFSFGCGNCRFAAANFLFDCSDHAA
jgi:hypothetical protein